MFVQTRWAFCLSSKREKARQLTKSRPHVQCKLKTLTQFLSKPYIFAFGIRKLNRFQNERSNCRNGPVLITTCLAFSSLKNTAGNYEEIKSFIVCDLTPCSPLKINRCFRGTFRLHLQYRRISEIGNQRESRWQAGDIFLRNVRWFSKDYVALYPRRQNSS
jgi:hypothetical protein